jgi:hypothetical protein
LEQSDKGRESGREREKYIPPHEQDDDFWRFGFAMPGRDPVVRGREGRRSLKRG